MALLSCTDAVNCMQESWYLCFYIIQSLYFDTAFSFAEVAHQNVIKHKSMKELKPK